MRLFSTHPADHVFRMAEEMQKWDSIDRGIPPTEWEHLTAFQRQRWMGKAIKRIRKESA